MVASAASVTRPQGTTPLRLGRWRDQVSRPSSQEEGGSLPNPPPDFKPCKADKADTVSALRVSDFGNKYRHSHPLSTSGRTGERGLVSRLGYPTASQAGQNNGKEPGRIVAAGGRVGKRRDRFPARHPALDTGLGFFPSGQRRREARPRIKYGATIEGMAASASFRPKADILKATPKPPSGAISPTH